MPPLAGGDWLLAWLFEAGPCGDDAMGVRGLSWPEIRAWRACTRTQAHPWELTLLKQLSAAYATAHHAAQEPDCPAYWLSPELGQADVARSEAAGAQLKSIFGALAKRSKSS